MSVRARHTKPRVAQVVKASKDENVTCAVTLICFAFFPTDCSQFILTLKLTVFISFELRTMGKTDVSASFELVLDPPSYRMIKNDKR